MKLLARTRQTSHKEAENPCKCGRKGRNKNSSYVWARFLWIRVFEGFFKDVIWLNALACD